MSRVSFFSSPLLLGFDQFERNYDRVQKAQSDGYPPYNVEQIGEVGYRITLAVAGFSTDELSVNIEDGQLVVRGRHHDRNGAVRVVLRALGVGGRALMHGEPGGWAGCGSGAAQAKPTTRWGV